MAIELVVVVADTVVVDAAADMAHCMAELVEQNIQLAQSSLEQQSFAGDRQLRQLLGYQRRGRPSDDGWQG